MSPPSTRSTRTPPRCSPRCCPEISPSTGSATSRANSTLPRRRGCQAPSHVTPDRQAPRPHHPGQEQSSLSPHRQRLQSHVARRPLPPHRLSHRFPNRPSRIETSAVMSIPGEELHKLLLGLLRKTEGIIA